MEETMSNADDLKWLLATAKDFADKDWCLSIPKDVKAVIGRLVNVIEESKPRTIETVEELDALADGSIVLDSDPDALLKTHTGSWRSLHDPEEPYGSRYLSLPATVLFEPAP
jgi:hypothetical protein